VDETVDGSTNSKIFTNSDLQRIKAQTVDEIRKKTQPPEKSPLPNEKSKSTKNPSTPSTNIYTSDEIDSESDLQTVDGLSTVDLQSSTTSTVSQNSKYKPGDLIKGNASIQWGRCPLWEKL
ncbi:hypothetical protein, partial [Crocosphaera sp. Alani8]|uniref:hypothetical protein n=1 Tax=Crocosphaera sp. Alani8 TaxID=3038952 RepID=UPI00313BF7EB